MFSLSFPELAVIAVVALLVLGPERLPKAARTAGALLRKARSSWNSVKSDIERELAADEIKRGLKEAADAGRETIEAQALAEPNAAKFLEGLAVRKVIIVPGKIVNIVAA